MVAEPHPRLGRLLALLLLVASLANGAPFLLARIGLIAPEAYQRDRQAFCPQAGPPAGLVSACSPRRVSPASSGVLERLSLERLHRSPPAWAWANRSGGSSPSAGRRLPSSASPPTPTMCG